MFAFLSKIDLFEVLRFFLGLKFTNSSPSAAKYSIPGVVACLLQVILNVLVRDIVTPSEALDKLDVKVRIVGIFVILTLFVGYPITILFAINCQWRFRTTLEHKLEHMRVFVENKTREGILKEIRTLKHKICLYILVIEIITLIHALFTEDLTWNLRSLCKLYAIFFDRMFYSLVTLEVFVYLKYLHVCFKMYIQIVGGLQRKVYVESLGQKRSFDGIP